MQETIERLRSASFAIVRRGYDSREVDSFLARLADWLEEGGSDNVRSSTVRRELERVSKKTGRILSSAEEAAESIRAEAEGEANQVVAEARADAASLREDADRYAEETTSDAEKKAKAMVAEGARRRRDMEKVIADLEKRRDAVLAHLRKISSALSQTAAAHTPANGSAEQARPRPRQERRPRGARAPSTREQ